jgi:hypothetical protein
MCISYLANLYRPARLVLCPTDGLKLHAVRHHQQQQQQQQRAQPQELQQQVVAAIAACIHATAAALEQLQPAVAQLQDRDEAVR